MRYFNIMDLHCNCKDTVSLILGNWVLLIVTYLSDKMHT